VQQKLKGSFVTSFHVQHQLDVSSGHSTHTVANTFVLKKLQLARRERGKHQSYSGWN
jgi:hypothetical protein